MNTETNTVEWFQVGPVSLKLNFDKAKTSLSYQKTPGAKLLQGSALVSLYYSGFTPEVVEVCR
jgi:hypothetical protein